jgi:hypothetical protein
VAGEVTGGDIAEAAQIAKRSEAGKVNMQRKASPHGWRSLPP